MTDVIRGGPVTNEIAAELQEALPQDPNKPKQFILILIALVGLLITVFTCLRTHDHKTALARLKNPTPEDIALLRKTVRKHLGFFGNFFHGDKVVKKALAIAANATEDRLVKLLAEQEKIQSIGDQ